MKNVAEYKNKYFSILGDSISTFEGYSVPDKKVFYDAEHKLSSGVSSLSDTWWGQVIDHLGGKLLVNNSISGSTVCWHPVYEAQIYGCSDERTSSLDNDCKYPDVIMVYLGTNDWRCGVKIYYDESCDCTPDSPSLFISAYRQMLFKLRRNYPNAEIWCFTLPLSRCSSDPKFRFPYFYGINHISEFCEAIQTCADEFQCKLIDLYNSSEAYDTIDGFHPNASGMHTIASAVIKELLRQS